MLNNTTFHLFYEDETITDQLHHEVDQKREKRSWIVKALFMKNWNKR